MRNNVAVIFAGGTGNRMNTVSRPKQFLELRGKPIIIYTLELFDNHPEIDGIVVVCLESWIPFLEKQIKKFEINKVVEIVPGGETGQSSIYNGLIAVEKKYTPTFIPFFSASCMLYLAFVSALISPVPESLYPTLIMAKSIPLPATFSQSIVP